MSIEERTHSIVVEPAVPGESYRGMKGKIAFQEPLPPAVGSHQPIASATRQAAAGMEIGVTSRFLLDLGDEEGVVPESRATVTHLESGRTTTHRVVAPPLRHEADEETSHAVIVLEAQQYADAS